MLLLWLLVCLLDSAAPRQAGPGCLLPLPAAGCLTHYDVDRAFSLAAALLPQPLDRPDRVSGDLDTEQVSLYSTSTTRACST